MILYLPKIFNICNQSKAKMGSNEDLVFVLLSTQLFFFMESRVTDRGRGYLAEMEKALF